MVNCGDPLTELWRVELRRGLHCLRQGDFDRAESHFVRAQRAAPTQPEVCYALGRECMRRGNYGRAEALLRVAWEGDDSLVSAAATLARLLALHLGRRQEGLALLADCEVRRGPRAVTSVVRSEILLDAGDLAGARASAESALRLVRQEEATESAAATTREAASAALARVYNEEGILLAASESDRALFAFKRAADLDPDWSSPHVNMGATFARLGCRDRARGAYETAVELEPGNPLAHYNLGLLLRQSGDCHRARTCLEAAIHLDPALGCARSALAELCLEQGDFQGAVDQLAAIAEQQAETPEVWINLAAALSAAGHLEAAEASFRYALVLRPDQEAARRGLAHVLARQARFLDAAAVAERRTPVSAPGFSSPRPRPPAGVDRDQSGTPPMNRS